MSFFMFKRTLILFFLLAFLLSACQSQATPTITESAAQDTQDLAAQGDSTGEASPVPAKTEQPASLATGDTSSVANCTVISRNPTPGPTEQSLFPPPGDADWVVGPDTAAMTIYEYSDFQ
jgi:hypothetical protein